MHTSGFYKTNYGAFSVRELIRMQGLLRLPFAFLITRYKKTSGPGVWMPGLLTEIECQKKDIPDHFWDITTPHRTTYEQLGFTEFSYTTVWPHLRLNPLARESYGIRYLHSNKTYLGGLFYVKMQSAQPVNRTIERVSLSITTAFQTGALSCSNVKEAFDPAPHYKVTRLSTDNVQVLYDRLLKDLKKLKRTPLPFPDHESFRQWFDKSQIEIFDHRVNRGLFIKMTDTEVAEARRKLPPPLPKT